VKLDDHVQDLGTDGIILKWAVTLWYLTSAIPTTQCDIQNAEFQVQMMGT
jgi:hypothetical protein